MRISRRTFVGGVAAWAGLAVGGCRCLSGRDGRTYSAAILGDLHYDRSPETFYHAKFISEFGGTGRYPGRFKELTRNAVMWQGPSRRILAASGKCVTDDTALVLQMGDLIQGDCNDFALHRRMLDETAALMKSAYPESLPFVTTCGNHDVREGGDGRDLAATPVYAAFARDFHRKELGGRACGAIEHSTFAFRQGPDLFLVLDFNQAEHQLELVRRLLDGNRDVRYTFVVTHGGIFPFDSWNNCRWFCLGGTHTIGLAFDPAADPVRREMRALLARRNAIVLCGHTHHLELKEADFPEGRITELTMNSVPFMTGGGEYPGEPAVVREGAASYGDVDWVRNEPTMKALFDEYRPFMRRYYFANAAGHARLRVSDDGVSVDYYGRDSLVPTKTFVLR